MAEEKKRQTLPPERLREVLARLDDVLTEAERLRLELTRQLEAHHQSHRQHLSHPAKPTASRRKRKR